MTLKEAMPMAATFAIVSLVVLCVTGGYMLGEHREAEEAGFTHPDKVTLYVTNPVTGDHGSLDCAIDEPGDIQLGIDVEGHTQSYNCIRGVQHALE